MNDLYFIPFAWELEQSRAITLKDIERGTNTPYKFSQLVNRGIKPVTEKMINRRRYKGFLI